MTTTSGTNSAHAVTKRLQADLVDLMKNKTPGISAFPVPGSLFKWKATIAGVAGTAYEGLSYKLDIAFSDEYPFKPPKVVFVTPCFHPNIDQVGNICLDILKDKWSAVYSVGSILLSVQSLLGEPNDASPLNQHAAELWKHNRAEYAEMVKRKHNAPQ